MGTKIHDLWYGTGWYNPYMRNNIFKLTKFNSSQKAKIKLQVIEFHNQYGTKATISAFNVCKSTIYKWKSMYLRSKKDLNSLVPESTRPKITRKSEVDIRVIEYIREQRELHPRLGKEKIKPNLDILCMRNNIQTVCESSIGRIIKRHGMTSPPSRIYHNPNTKRYVHKRKERVKYSPKSVTSGYFEIDTIKRFVDGVTLYVYNAVDIHTRFEFSFGYHTDKSITTVDFFKMLELVCPYKICTVQTDNGHEYLGDFEQYLKTRSVKQVFIYPRCPKINGYVERANRTLTEEFLDYHQYDILSEGIEGFNRKLIDHLIWFNTERGHHSLSKLSPIQYMIKYLPKSIMYGTYTFAE